MSPKQQAKFMTSVLQSAVFNLWLGARVLEPGLSIARLGDVLKKRDTGGLFHCEEPEVDGHRLADGEIDPTGPLFGPKLKVAREAARTFEMKAESRLNLSEAQRKLLGRFGAGTSASGSSVSVRLSFERVGARLKFSFRLPSGVYAMCFSLKSYKYAHRLFTQTSATNGGVTSVALLISQAKIRTLPSLRFCVQPWSLHKSFSPVVYTSSTSSTDPLMGAFMYIIPLNRFFRSDLR